MDPVQVPALGLCHPTARRERLCFSCLGHFVCLRERGGESHRILVIPCKYYYWHLAAVRREKSQGGNQNISLENAPWLRPTVALQEMFIEKWVKNLSVGALSLGAGMGSHMLESVLLCCCRMGVRISRQRSCRCCRQGLEVFSGPASRTGCSFLPASQCLLGEGPCVSLGLSRGSGLPGITESFLL